jgi:tRNA A-37 threonylcarbamoyl transferase component Bud32
MSNKLLGQGSYGCVYYPGIDCNAEYNKSKYVTKIQIKGSSTQNEINIGNIIKEKIKNYNKYFVIIIKSCPITINQINKKNKIDLNECKFLKEYNENFIDPELNNKTLYLTYLKRVNGNDFNTFYKIYFKKNRNISIIINNYKQLNFSTNLLYENKIIHNDMHIHNIMVNRKNNNLLIIDFGLSFIYNKDIEENIYKYLLYSSFDNYRTHECFDKRFCRFIIDTISEKYKIEEATVETIRNIDNFLLINDINTFKKRMLYEFNKNFSNILSDKNITYINNLLNYYDKYIEYSKYPKLMTIFTDIYKNIGYIDQYSVNINYLHVYNYYIKYNLQENNIYICKFLKQLWLIGIHPTINMRFTYNQTILYLDKIIELVKKHKIDNEDFKQDVTQFLTDNKLLNICTNFDINYEYLFKIIDFNIIL